jgi:hypothetical protein
MTTVDAMWTAAMNNLEDDVVKAALADSLEDDGQHDVALAVYWCLDRRRWPARRYWSSTDDSFTWHAGKANRIATKITATLPSPLYRLTTYYIASDSNAYTRVEWFKARRDLSFRGRFSILSFALRQCRDIGSRPAILPSANTELAA